jgi:hypothetical protein
VVVMKSTILWDMTPCSPLSCTRRFGGSSGATQRTTRRHIAEDDTLYKYFIQMQITRSHLKSLGRYMRDNKPVLFLEDSYMFSIISESMSI